MMQSITRREFVAQMGGAALFTCACSVLTGCSGDGDSFPAPPTNVDLRLDISSGALAAKGGFIVTEGLIVGRTQSDGFIAVSAACTHQGTTVQYQSSENRFHCPNHGSNYDESGSVINGPATKSLVKYNTELTGTSLRVFS